jgi:hypothetical protein
MPTRAKVFIPRGLLLEPKKLERAINNALDGAAFSALVDFKVTHRTWITKPIFRLRTPGPGVRLVYTDNLIYHFVSGGTRPHAIVPKKKGGYLVFKSGFTPKSRFRYIGSNKGSKFGPTVFAKKVKHPGTQAREFEQAIGEKWDKELPKTLQRAIDSEI